MKELLLRFLIGGSVVSVFALLGEVLRPKSFAGIFGAAPSIALATLGLTIRQHGGAYAAIEGRSMMAGAAAFVLYAVAVSYLLMRNRGSALAITVLALPVWLAASFGVWARWLR